MHVWLTVNLMQVDKSTRPPKEEVKEHAAGIDLASGRTSIKLKII